MQIIHTLHVVEKYNLDKQFIASGGGGAQSGVSAFFRDGRVI